MPAADAMGCHALQAKEVIGIGSPAWLAGLVAAGMPVIQEHQKQQQKQQVPQSEQQQPQQVCHHGVFYELLYENGSWEQLPGLCASMCACCMATRNFLGCSCRGSIPSRPRRRLLHECCLMSRRCGRWVTLPLACAAAVLCYDMCGGRKFSTAVPSWQTANPA